MKSDYPHVLRFQIGYNRPMLQNRKRDSWFQTSSWLKEKSDNLSEISDKLFIICSKTK